MSSSAKVNVHAARAAVLLELKLSSGCEKMHLSLFPVTLDLLLNRYHHVSLAVVYRNKQAYTGTSSEASWSIKHYCLDCFHS